MFRYLRDLAVGVVAGCLVGLIAVYSGNHATRALWLGLLAGLLVFGLALLADRQRGTTRRGLSEQERLRERQLRSRVGLIRTELLALRADVIQMQASGRYWDPQRSNGLVFVRRVESGGQLQEDKRTSQAFDSCVALEIEVQRIRRLVNGRWGEWASYQMLDPQFQVYAPLIHPEDGLPRTLALIKKASKDLDTALKRLNA